MSSNSSRQMGASLACVTGGSVHHIFAVSFTEVTFRFHIRIQQTLIAPGQADHGVINGRVPVGLSCMVRPTMLALLIKAGKQLHIVHSVKQLAVGGLYKPSISGKARERITLMA